MRYIALIILVSIWPVCAIAEVNLNGDNLVNFEDFAIFANAWQTDDANCDFNTDGIVDYKDLAVLAGQWLSFVEFKTLTVSTTTGGTVTTPGIGNWPYDYNTYATITAAADTDYNFINWTGSAVTEGKVDNPNSISTIVLMDANYSVQANFINIDMNTPPIVSDSNISTYNFLTIPITLSATDTGSLKYIITSLPAEGNLQDPASGAGIIEARHLPYTLSTRGNTVWFTTDSNGAYSFTWKASDGGCDSNTATVHITVTEHPRDYVSTDGQGYLSAADSEYLDLDGDWGACLWIKTRDVFGTILQKYDGTNGFKLGIEDGRLKLWLYKDGSLQTIKSDAFTADGETFTGKNVSDGQWHFCYFTVSGSEVSFYIYGETILDTNFYGRYIEDGNCYDANNSAPILILTDGVKNTRADIDRLCIYNNDPGVNLNITFLLFAGRTSTDYDWGSAPTLEWRFNGDTVDSIHGLVAQISDANHVSFKPFNKPFYDVSVQGAR